MAAFRLADAPRSAACRRDPSGEEGARRGDGAVGSRRDRSRPPRRSGACRLHDGEPVVRAVWREGRRVA